MHPIQLHLTLLALLLVASPSLAHEQRKLSQQKQNRIAKVFDAANRKYFPNILSAFAQAWYANALLAMGEESLQTLPKPTIKFVFRFLWLRSFHHPITIRITKYGDGKTTLTAKELSGRGGWHLIKDVEVVWTEEQFQQLQQKLSSAKFYNQKSVDTSVSGFDGAQWIFETNDSGRYHIVDRWSPKDELRDLGIYLLKSGSLLPQENSDIY